MKFPVKEREKEDTLANLVTNQSHLVRQTMFMYCYSVTNKLCPSAQTVAFISKESMVDVCEKGRD